MSFLLGRPIFRCYISPLKDYFNFQHPIFDDSPFMSHAKTRSIWKCLKKMFLLVAFGSTPIHLYSSGPRKPNVDPVAILKSFGSKKLHPWNGSFNCIMFQDQRSTKSPKSSVSWGFSILKISDYLTYHFQKFTKSKLCSTKNPPKNQTFIFCCFHKNFVSQFSKIVFFWVPIGSVSPHDLSSTSTHPREGSHRWVGTPTKPFKAGPDLEARKVPYLFGDDSPWNGWNGWTRWPCWTLDIFIG